MFQCFLPTTRWFRAIIIAILAIILFISYASPVIAQQDNRNFIQVFIEEAQLVLKGRAQRKELTKPNGSPRGGGFRGDCPELIALGKDEIPLTAFVPVIPEEQPSSSKSDDVSLSKLNYVWGQTTEEYPTFWFYIPYVYKKSEVGYGKFVLLDKDKHSVAGPIFVKIPEEQPSIGKFTLPESAKPLKNKEYIWYFSIICDPLKPSRNPGVTGWIEKVTSRFLPVKDYQYYAQQGIWYDTVTRLFNSQNSQTQQLQQNKILLIKYIFSSVIEKPQKEEDFNYEEKLNQIAERIASFEPQILKPIQFQ
ncbi:hypothetical protein WA1_27210 [Scytonema hofmannii PCC 7110]|uniref:DUF928 domain-containing protein n=1 Tax=Scytonema hofmannii PCC 7110 TaxID=128403 RepID=A0A139X699_9CYAN|nr:DUF928 domain-containing protein [Scytonema hofmannii]KYC40228.1 hypothetical protein WA1_27210 [Scytonema hofmannii PCC 7110]